VKTTREYPVWIPVNDHHIAAVVALPEGDPRAVVLFTTGGGGAPRSQRFRLWTRAARELADRGIASVRMEYEGVGDSTGAGRIGLKWSQLPTDDVIEVAKFAMSVTGTTQLGMSGNCAGARACIKAVDALPECKSLVLFWLKPIAAPDRGTRRFQSGVRLFRLLPDGVKRKVAKAYWYREGRASKKVGVENTLREAAAGRDVLLIETSSALAGEIPAVIQDLQRASNGHRVELRQVESTSMQAFQSPAEQEMTVTTVLEWFDASFPGASGEEEALEPGQPASVQGSS
jgi:predicted alpha/beta-hydrolase family hydrolase